MNFKPRNLRSPASAGTSNTRNAETGFIRLKALLCSLFAFAAIFSTFAIGPSWWQSRGVVSTNANIVTNDFAPATLGQLKWIAKQAAEELDASLPGGAGTAVTNLVASFTDTNNYLIVNIGQAKAVAAPFYDRLIAVGLTNACPWAGATNAVNDFAPINLGQLKELFSFDPQADSDGDGFSDINEIIADTDPYNVSSFPVTISGNVSYGGSQPGLIIVVARYADGPHTGTVAGVCELAGSQGYSIGNIPNESSYQLTAFVDSGGNATQHAWDATGSFSGNPLFLNSNSNGIDIALTDVDSDSDGMPDWWEMMEFGDLSQAATGDYDNDGLLNGQETKSNPKAANRTVDLGSWQVSIEVKNMTVRRHKAGFRGFVYNTNVYRTKTIDAESENSLNCFRQCSYDESVQEIGEQSEDFSATYSIALARPSGGGYIEHKEWVGGCGSFTPAECLGKQHTMTKTWTWCDTLTQVDNWEGYMDDTNLVSCFQGSLGTETNVSSAAFYTPPLRRAISWSAPTSNTTVSFDQQGVEQTETIDFDDDHFNFSHSSRGSNSVGELILEGEESQNIVLTDYYTDALLDQTARGGDLNSLCLQWNQVGWSSNRQMSVDQQGACGQTNVTTNTMSGAVASAYMDQGPTSIVLRACRYRIALPTSETGTLYRATVVHLFTPSGASNATSSVVAIKSFSASGTGTNLLLNSEGEGTEVTIQPPQSNGTITIQIRGIHVENPVDVNQNGYVDDFANRSSNRTGNAFDFDNTSNHVCVIPIRISIWPDTEELRAKLAGNVKATLDELTPDSTEGVPILSWCGNSDAEDESGQTGILAYNSNSALWCATAVYSNLPAVPTNSYGRVPRGLHALLAKARKLSITVENCDWLPEESRNQQIDYELYYGENLRIFDTATTNMADITYNFTRYNNALIAAGGSVGVELFEKMNCAGETFEFDHFSEAEENYKFRHNLIALLAQTSGRIRSTAADKYCGMTTMHRVSMTSAIWNVPTGAFWRYYNNDNRGVFVAPPNFTLVQIGGTDAYKAVVESWKYNGDCLGALQFATFQTAALLMGSSRFNSVHPAQAGGPYGSGPLRLKYVRSEFAFCGFASHLGAFSDEGSLIPGDPCFLQNYDYEERGGSDGWGAENCVYGGWRSNNDYEGTFAGASFGRLSKEEWKNQQFIPAYIKAFGSLPGGYMVTNGIFGRLIIGD